MVLSHDTFHLSCADALNNIGGTSLAYMVYSQ